MHSMRSAQHQVELKRLGNQLPVLDRANSRCKMLCSVRVKDITGYRSSGNIGVASRRCATVPVVPPGGGKILTPAFSFADVDTYERV